MISSKADFFFFFSPLESELESFLFTEDDDDEDDDAFRALAPRTELKEDTSTQLETERLKYIIKYFTQNHLYLDLEGPATEEQAPRLKATTGESRVKVSRKYSLFQIY